MTEWKPIRIELFGGLRVVSPGGPCTVLPAQQPGVLLAYLVLRPRRVHTRDELVELLWPDEDPEATRPRLRQCLHVLRRLLESDAEGAILVSTRSSVELNAELVATDVDDFEQALRAASRSSDLFDCIEQLSRAVSLYCGDLLPGFSHDFVLVEQRRLAEAQRTALRKLTLAYEELRQLDNAVECATRAVALDPLAEEAHCDLMRLYAAQGKSSAVTRQYRELSRLLSEELDESPSRSTHELMESLRADAEAVAARGASGHRLKGDSIGTLPAPPPSVPELRRFPVRPRRQIRRPVAMLAALAALVAVCAVIIVHVRTTIRPRVSAAGGREMWIARFRPGPEDRDSEPTSIATDAAGYTYVAGFVQTRRNDVDYLVLKLAPGGGLLWQQRYNGPGNDVDRARAIALDGMGGLVVTGDSDNGHGNGATHLSGLDVATVRIDANGTRLWEARYNGPANGEDVPCKVSFDNALNVYVAATRWERRAGGTGRHSMVLIKYDRAGKQQWVRSYAPSAFDEYGACDMVVLPDGRAFVAGAIAVTHRSKVPASVVVRAYGSSGRSDWTWTCPSAAPIPPGAVRIGTDGVGHLVIGATMMPTDRPNSGRTGILVARLDYQGHEQWRTWQGPPGDPISAYVLDSMALDSVGCEWLVGEQQRGYRDSEYIVLHFGPDGILRGTHEARGAVAPGTSARSVVGAGAGGVVVTGSAAFTQPDLPGSTRGEYLTISYGANDQERWQRRYGDPWHGDDRAVVTASLPGGGTVVSGQAYGGDTRDIVTVAYGP